MRPPSRKPTGRLQKRNPHESSQRVGLGQSSYSLWHYHDTSRAIDRVVNETQASVGSQYARAASDYADAVAEGVVQIVNENGGSAHIEERSVTEDFGHYKLAVVESMAPRSDVDALVEQMISQAKDKDYSSNLSREGLEIIFEEIRHSETAPEPDYVARNRHNPKPIYFHPTVTPIVHWKKVSGSAENNGNGSTGNGDSGDAVNGDIQAVVYRVEEAQRGSDSIVVRNAQGTVPTGLKQTGGTIRVIVLAQENGDGPHIEPIDYPSTDPSPTDHNFGVQGLGVSAVQNFDFTVPNTSGAVTTLSQNRVRIRVKPDVPSGLYNAVRDGQPATVIVTSQSPASNGGGDNGTNGGNGNGGDNDTGSNGATIGPPAPLQESQVIPGVPNTATYIGGGVLIAGVVLAALSD